MFSLEILYRKLCFFCPRGLSYYLRSFYSCVLTTEVYGDSREEEEEQEGGEDAASAAILPAELSREANVAVGGQDRARCPGTAESSGAHRAH